MAFALACGLLLALLGLVVPFVLNVFVDHALGEGRPWVGLLAGILAAAAALAYGTTVLKERCLQSLAVRLSITTGSRSVSKLLRLPVEYFSHRLAGEVSSRIPAIDQIAAGFPHHMLELMIELAMSAIFLAAILALDLRLALILLALGILNAALAMGAAHLRTDADHAWRREQWLLTGVGTLMLHNANSLRMAAADDSFFARWSEHQAREVTARQRFAELSHVIASMPGLFLILASAAVLAFGATDVMDGRMTVGALASFHYLTFLFFAPISRFAELADQHQELEADIQRLEDITQFPEDPGLKRDPKHPRRIATLHGRLRLAGHVELQDITFGYNRARSPVVKDFNLVIEPGQRMAVVGASGSGESTLSRLVSGLYEPWSGAILFDGRQPREISREVFSRSLSVVDQRSALFAGTVRDNITLWNPAVPDDLVVAAARDACIHDEILSRPLGYGTEVDENGGNFSGGQRQRLGVARALASNPTVSILDETTSALDTWNEELANDALRRRGIACLIVAHRLSTVRDCDEIIVLDKRVAAQRGTHDELMTDETGLHCRLVKAG